MKRIAATHVGDSVAALLDLEGLDDALFEEASLADSGEADRIVRPCLTYWQDAWLRFRKNKVAMLGLCVIVFYVVMSLVGPRLVSFDFRDIDEAQMDSGPGPAHWFGTDTLGRDMWARVWVGGVSGYFGGRLDMVIMRFIDVLTGIPSLIVSILVMVVMGAGIRTRSTCSPRASWAPATRASSSGT